MKCLVAPEVPNNAGSLAPITVSAPEGCVLNVKRPWPVAARHTVGHMLPDVVFGCLHQAIAGGVPAEGASSLWNPQIFGGGSLVDEVEEGTDANALAEFSTVIFHCGGAGARPGKDGLERHRLPVGRAHHPGRGNRERGAGGVLSPRVPRGLGRRGPVPRRARPGDRARRRGCDSGRAAVQFRAGAATRRAGATAAAQGAPGAVSLRSGRPIRPKGRQTVPPRDAIRLELPGGGGFGDPRARDPHRVLDDVRDGLITAEEARRDYGVVIDAHGQLDAAATERLRSA